MSQFNVSNLSPMTNRPVLFQAGIYASDHNSFRKDAKLRLDQLRSFLQAQGSLQSGAGAPNRFQGSIWGDTSTANVTTWKGDPDGIGNDDEFATRLTAKNSGFTAPGGLIKVGGKIGFNAQDIQTSYTTTPLVLISAPIPANTLQQNGSKVDIKAVIEWPVSGPGPVTLDVRFGGTSVGGHLLNGTPGSTFIHEYSAEIIRVSATEQKIISRIYWHRDDLAAIFTSKVLYGVLNKTLSVDNTFELVNVGPGGQLVTHRFSMWGIKS